jgi:hypothetical protein
LDERGSEFVLKLIQENAVITLPQVSRNGAQVEDFDGGHKGKICKIVVRKE